MWAKAVRARAGNAGVGKGAKGRGVAVGKAGMGGETRERARWGGGRRTAGGRRGGGERTRQREQATVRGRGHMNEGHNLICREEAPTHRCGSAPSVMAGVHSILDVQLVRVDVQLVRAHYILLCLFLQYLQLLLLWPVVVAITVS